MFVLTTDSSSGVTPLLESVIRTKKSLEESSQRAHATFENGADPSGPDLGLNLYTRTRIITCYLDYPLHTFDANLIIRDANAYH